jgi:hypothetical protein
MHTHETDFDIDVDITSLLGDVEGETLIRDVWYRLAMPSRGRSPRVQYAAKRMLDNTLHNAQWAARERRRLDRRRALRVPLLSRVRPGRGSPLISTDISLSGLRASGTPTAPVMNIEFKVPGLAFPIDARVEVMSFKDSNVIPLVGMRFINLERPYADHIARYVAKRRERQLAA